MHKPATHSESATGALLAVGAFMIWGFSPVYFKSLQAVPALQILLHRIVWSLLLLLAAVVITGRWSEFKAVIGDRRKVLVLTASTVLIATNWFVFIWAVNHDHVLDASLGYYINPLINVLLGTVFLKERLRLPQTAAVVLAFIAVAYLTVQLGTLPWISLVLAVSFAFYSLIRKVAPVNAMVGLTVETLVLSLPAAAMLVYLGFHGRGAFLNVSLRVDVLLLSAALVTAVPLLLFTAGARRIHLSTAGILQYIGPSCNFLLAVFVYHEPIQPAQVVTFILIWTALTVYTTDSIRAFRHRRLRPSIPIAAEIQSASSSAPDSDRR